MEQDLHSPVRGWKWVAIALASGIVASCASQTPTTEASPPVSETPLPEVVASSSVLCDLTQQIAQDTIQLTCLIDPGQDPHTYEPTPSDRRAIDDADLILYDGYGYSPDIIRLVEATTNPAPKVAVLEQAVPEPLMGQGHDHDHDHGTGEADEHGHAGAEADDHDHAHEGAEADDHDHAYEDGVEAVGEVPDPHLWHNAEHGAAIAQIIAENLGAIVPEQASTYQENATQIANQLTAIHRWIPEQVATVPEANRKLVTPHDAFRYFAAAYDFGVAGALSGLSTEETIAAGRLTELVDLVKDAGVPAIFAETTTNPKSIEAIARDAEVSVASQPLFVEGPAGPNSPAENYQAMLVVNTCTIVNALGGTCTLESAPALP